MNRKISQQQCLRYVYKHSLKTLNNSVNSVHSNTLKELYTEAYRPIIQNSGETFIKNLQTGMPEKVKLTGKNLKFFSTKNVKRKCYTIKNDNNKTLGTKSFGLYFLSKEETPLFLSGVIQSYQNNKYAGVQIRLLQAACELAKKYNIKTIPLTSEPQALVFHTMMGFRPQKHLTIHVDSIKNLKRHVMDYKNCIPQHLQRNVTEPIVSKSGNKYYLDYNRTLFCDVLELDKEMLKSRNCRNLGRTYRNLDDDISMSLSGNQLNKWFERLKGFEILDENECIALPKSILQRLKDFFKKSTQSDV